MGKGGSLPALAKIFGCPSLEGAGQWNKSDGHTNLDLPINLHHGAAAGLYFWLTTDKPQP